MLSKADLREMQALVTRIGRGSVSREDWASLAALTLIFEGDAIVAGIAAGGYGTFKAISQPIYERHQFHEDDFRRIYQRVCAAAARYERDVVRH